jgi:hypothetical protein
MVVMDAIRQSARERRWVDLASAVP